MRQKRREGLLWPILAGTSLAARIRRVTFAVFGLAAACGLALVSYVAQTGYPVLSVAPLPLPGSAALPATGNGVALGGTDGGSSGVGFGLGLPGLPGEDGGSGAFTATVVVDGGDGVLTSLGSGGSTQSGLDAPSGKSGLDGEQHTDVTAVTPAQQPTIPPESALAAVPVEGSDTSSGLFVRTSVAPGLGEEGDVADSAPLPPDEPEIPYEPEPTVEPEPPAAPPVEPEPEPEPPAEEVPVETEPTPETPPVVEEPAPEVPAGQ